jgi:hypothetical protein
MPHQGLAEPPDALDVVRAADDVGLDKDRSPLNQQGDDLPEQQLGASACSTRARRASMWGSIS